MSMSSLKRQLKCLGLFRRKYYTDVLEVTSFILENFSGSAQNHGYKIMHLKCLQNGCKVMQETVHLLLLLLDPEGVKFRSCNRLRRRLYSNSGPIIRGTSISMTNCHCSEFISMERLTAIHDMCHGLRLMLQTAIHK